MPLLILGGAIVLLLLLIVRCKLNAFLALLLAYFTVALLNGMAPAAALKSILTGIGDTMGGLVLILVFGAMLGKLIEESGAAHSISHALTTLLGLNRIQLSVLLTGFLVGLPMIYNASFLVLIPLIYTLSATTGLPLLYLGIPLSAALSVTHGYLPPHPAPTSIAVMFGADVNTTLLYGLILAVPGAILAGPVLALFFRKLRNAPPPELYKPRQFQPAELPGLTISLFTILIPVLLMLAGALWKSPLIRFVADPNIALFLAVLAGFYTLGLRRGRDMDGLMKSMAAAVASVSMVILIIAAGGAFKQVLLDCGTGDVIKNFASQSSLSPLLLAWSTAALLRLALGSATVAAITAAGVILPIVPGCGVAPELLVLATTAGSLMFSHFNDIGFWMFKEYYGVTIRQTFQIWTVMESIVAVVGLLGAFAIHALAGAPPQKRVFYVNSYHAGYPSSDQAAAALRAALQKEGVTLRELFLDAKRDPDPTALTRRASAAATAIRAFNPRVLIVSDDDAMKYVVVPHFRDGRIPVVFCGVNWSADHYALPPGTATGMLEAVPVEEVLRQVRAQFPSTRKLRVLSEDSTSEQSNRRLLDPKYRALGFEPSYSLVTEFSDWKREFLLAQKDADVLYLPTNGAIRGWDHSAAIQWARTHTRKPTVTCDDFMMPYVALGLTKVAAEQGEHAAMTALRILNGTLPRQIPVVSNTRQLCFVNPALAQAAGLRPPPGMACQSVR